MGAVMAAVIDGVLVVGRGVAAVEADCGEVLAVDPQAKIESPYNWREADHPRTSCLP